jgi:hypothetical protein
VSKITVIFRDVPSDDFILAERAIKWLLRQPETQRDAIVGYGEGTDCKHFYVKRNKASVTVSPC